MQGSMRTQQQQLKPSDDTGIFFLRAQIAIGKLMYYVSIHLSTKLAKGNWIKI